MNRTLLLSALASAMLLSACAAKRYTSFNVLQPAEVALPQGIQQMVVVNRTLPENSTTNTIEGVLTGEGLFQDRQGAERVVSGITQALGESPRFTVRFATEQLQGSGSGGMFPGPLKWLQVEKLCNKYQSDAVVAIETYDSDFIVTNGNAVERTVNEDGDSIRIVTYWAEGVAQVKMGFRIYWPGNEEIVDQFTVTDRNTWRTQGSTLTEAVQALIAKDDAVKRVSYMIGHAYGQRISPHWIRVTRLFYQRPKDELARGARRAEVNDWEGAIEAWLPLVNHSDDKVAGRAANNIAVAYELLDDLETAKLWAQRAYGDFGEKNARSYANTLQNRIVQEERLRQQMGQ